MKACADLIPGMGEHAKGLDFDADVPEGRAVVIQTRTPDESVAETR